MSLKQYLNLDTKKNGTLYDGKFVDYSNLEINFFQNWETFWKNNIGIKEGMRIGLFLSKNELIMPTVLSLDNIICEIEFFNSGMSKQYIESNTSKCNFIISDYNLNYKVEYSKKKIEIFKKNVFIYCFDEMNSVNKERKSFVYYTSGTTGNPKAFYKTEESVIKEGLAILEELKISQSDKILCIAPCGHVFAQSVACIAAMLAGAKVQYMQSVISPNYILRNIRQYKYDILLTTPLYFEHLHSFKEDLKGIRELVTGGARLSRKVLESNMKITCFYGSTETGVISINKGMKQENLVGKVVKGVEIIEGEKILKTKEHELKKIVVKSDFNAYACRREQQAYMQMDDKIILNDYGYLKGENLFVVGRIDNIININGLKVSTTEIENELIKNVCVDKVKVVKKEDDFKEYALAYVVLKKEFHIAVEEIYEFCKINMEHYKIPKKIELVNELHYTETGKVSMN